MEQMAWALRSVAILVMCFRLIMRHRHGELKLEAPAIIAIMLWMATTSIDNMCHTGPIAHVSTAAGTAAAVANVVPSLAVTWFMWSRMVLK